jgi:hypothetical protein
MQAPVATPDPAEAHTPVHRTRRPPFQRTVLVCLAFLAVTSMCTVAPVTGTAADAGSTTLRLGDADLVETRTVETLAPGVTLTRIQRGDTPADPDQILTTRRGPWRVTILTVDRTLAQATFGSPTVRTCPAPNPPQSSSD